jgi:hypothetical protein
MVPHRDAARDLDVDQLVQCVRSDTFCLRTVADQAHCDAQPLLARVGIGHPHLDQAAFETGHVLGKSERASVVDRHYFVDAVAEDEAAVHDADLGVAQWRECAVEVAGGRRQ